MADIYFRNPEKYYQEMQEMGVRLLSWDYGDLARKNIDPIKFARLYLGQSRPWKALVVAIEGVAEYNETSPNRDEPVAVYPAWRREYGYDRLRDYCANPVGEDLRLCFNEYTEPRFRPVFRQPHKVVIYDAPNLMTHEGLSYLRQLREVKEEFPHVAFIIHDTASFRVMFGLDFEGVIFDPHMTAQRSSVILPNGRAVGPSEMQRFDMWIKALGHSVRDLRSTTFDRVVYNIDSVRWAAKHFRENINFRVAVIEDIDPDAPDAEQRIDTETHSWLTMHPSRRPSMLPGDGILCDGCSLIAACKYYREGAVCGVPKTDAAKLATMFGTRDAGVIIDGLLELTQIQAERVGADLAAESTSGERLPMTDKRIKDLFDAGTKVAKLIDPTLNGKGTTVNVGVIGAASVAVEQTPQELMGSVVKALEAQGFKREEITPDMIRGVIEGMGNRSRVEEVVDAEVLEIEA